MLNASRPGQTNGDPAAIRDGRGPISTPTIPTDSAPTPRTSARTTRRADRSSPRHRRRNLRATPLDHGDFAPDEAERGPGRSPAFLDMSIPL